MTTITLIRRQRSGKAVTGQIYLPFEEGERVYDTLENADYIIPAGTYPVKKSWSPKFKKILPEICDVPNRYGIRIHRGSVPEHSQGCILVGWEAIQIIDIFINRVNNYYEDELSIAIKEAF